MTRYPSKWIRGSGMGQMQNALENALREREGYQTWKQQQAAAGSEFNRPPLAEDYYFKDKQNEIDVADLSAVMRGQEAPSENTRIVGGGGMGASMIPPFQSMQGAAQERGAPGAATVAGMASNLTGADMEMERRRKAAVLNQMPAAGAGRGGPFALPVDGGPDGDQQGVDVEIGRRAKNMIANALPSTRPVTDPAAYGLPRSNFTENEALGAGALPFGRPDLTAGGMDKEYWNEIYNTQFGGAMKAAADKAEAQAKVETAGGAISPREKATLEAETERYKADKTSALRNMLTPQNRFNFTRQLQGDWRKLSGSTSEVDRQINLMREGLRAAKTGDLNAGSQAVLVTFQKILDPSSVVRESEYARSPQGVSMLGRMEGFIDRLSRGGAGVPVADLEQFVRTAEQFSQHYKNSLEGERARMTDMAVEAGLDPTQIFPSKLETMLAPEEKTVTMTELSAIAQRRGTSVEQEKARAEAEGFIVR